MKRLLKLLHFLLFYLCQVVQCNMTVAHDILTRRHHMLPGFLTIAVNDLSDRQLLILSNLLSMTPGTVVVDIDEQRQLLLHAMYLDDADELRRHLETDYIRRIKEIF